MAGEMFIYKDNRTGQVLLSNVNSNTGFEKFSQKVKVTYYPESKALPNSEIKTISKQAPTAAESYLLNERNNKKATQIASSKSNSSIQSNTVVRNDNVARFYKPVDWPEAYKKNFEYRKSSEEVRVVETNDINKTANSMTEDGYKVLGVSEFNERKLPETAFLSQARKIGSSFVVVYKQGVSSVPYDKYDDLNDLDYAFHYYVAFYVKDNLHNQPNMLGIQMNEIPSESRVKYQRNTGAYVTNVIKGTKAYNANIIPGDVIIAINDIKVMNSQELDNIKNIELKTTKNLNLTIIRLVNNEPKEIQIPISMH